MKEVINLFKNKKNRRIIFVSLVFSLLFAGAAIYELNWSHELELKRAEIQARNLSQVLEEQLSATFKNIDLTLLGIVRTIQDRKYKDKIDVEDAKHLLEERLTDIEGAKEIFILDQNGNDLLRVKDGKTISLSDRDFFIQQKNAQKEELFFSKPAISKMTKRRIIVISRRILDRNHQFAGIVAAAIPLSYFKKIYSKLEIGKKGAITLMSDENIMYARYPWDEENIGIQVPTADFAVSVFNQREKLIYDLALSPLDGVSRFYSARRVPNTKFVIMVGISEKETFAAWKKRCTLYSLIFAFVWIAGIFYLFNFLKSLQELEDSRKIAIQSAKLNSLGEMASGIAHEINNPLTVISSRCSQLKRQIERNQYDPDSFKATLIKINQTVERIAVIIRGLKSFSRNAENDKFINTSLKTIIENTLELCTEKFRHQLVFLHTDTIPDYFLECREAQLVQVLLSLLNNSYDAVVNLEEKWVHISFSLNMSGDVLIIITDSGKGIPRNIAQNIMQPFFTTKEVGKGTGLGLSISKGIIEDHKGTFYLDEKCINTRFIIELPISDSSQVNNYWSKIS